MLEIRKSTDAATIARLNEPVQTLHHTMYPDIFKPFELNAVTEYFEQSMLTPNAHFYICLDDSEPIGYIWFDEVRRLENAFSHAKHMLYVNQVSVNESYRGKGVGRKLFEAALEYAAEHDVKKIALDYWSKNDHAREVYKRYGFEIGREVTYLELD